MMEDSEPVGLDTQEQVLRDTEQRYRVTFESAPIGIVNASPDGRLLGVNQAFAQMLGYSIEQLVGTKFSDYIHPDDMAASVRLRRDLIEGRADRGSLEKRYIRRDGSTLWGKVSVAAVRDGGGALQYTVAMIEDQTERRQADQQRDRFFRLSLDMLCIAGTDGYFRSLNPAWEKTLGYSIEHLLSRSLLDFVHPADQASTMAELKKLKHGEATIHFENRYRCQDGTWRWLEWTCPPAEGETGTIYAVARDVTERKRSERALKVSEERYRQLYHNTPVLMHSIDREGKLVSVNDHWLATLAYRRQEVIGRKSTEFLTEASRRYAQQVILPRFFETGYCENVPYQMLTKEGKAIDVLLSATSQRDEQGHVIRSLAMMVDITARKRAEDALRRREESYRGMADQLEVLLRELDHRVKNNLAALHSLVSMYEQSSGTVKEFADRFRDKLTAMNTVHEIIASAGWRSMELAALVKALAGQFARPGHWGEHLQVNGPPLAVAPRQAGALAMVFQELFANCQKYGAFSVPTGSVRLHWQVIDRSGDKIEVGIDWFESGGPVPAAPLVAGQGLRLVEGFMRSELSGSCEFRAESAGFACRLRCGFDASVAPSVPPTDIED